MDTLSLVHSGNRVEFNTVNFVESRLWRPCCFGPVHTGNKVERTFNIRSTKATELATVLTATSCRIQIVADLLPKPYKQQSTVTETGDKSATKSTVLNSTLSPVCTGLYSEILWNKSVKSPPPSVCLALPSSTPATRLDQSAIDRLVRIGDRRTNKQTEGHHHCVKSPLCSGAYKFMLWPFCI